MSYIQELEKLKQLLDEGVITTAEFEARKHQILANPKFETDPQKRLAQKKSGW